MIRALQEHCRADPRSGGVLSNERRCQQPPEGRRPRHRRLRSGLQAHDDRHESFGCELEFRDGGAQVHDRTAAVLRALTMEDLGRLTHWVLWAAFAVAMAFGAIVQRTGFCTMGAVTDAAALGEWTRMRQWALAAATAITGFALLAAFGRIDPAQTLYASSRWLWLSALAGGAVFGFGMVLASGCASKTLVRGGGGNLKSAVVVLVIGIAAFATLKGLTAVWRVASVDRVGVDFASNASLSSLIASAFGLPPRV